MKAIQNKIQVRLLMIHPQNDLEHSPKKTQKVIPIKALKFVFQ